MVFDCFRIESSIIVDYSGHHGGIIFGDHESSGSDMAGGGANTSRFEVCFNEFNHPGPISGQDSVHSTVDRKVLIFEDDAMARGVRVGQFIREIFSKNIVE